MADTALPKDQAIALLTRLSSDDAFRERYAANPRNALLEVGVPAEALGGLEGNLTPIRTLPHKSAFAAALAQLQLDAAEVCLCKQPPTIKLNIGH